MTTIGLLGMGAMGSAIAARLSGSGARVLTDLSGRSGATRQRAEAAGAEDVGLEEMIARSEMILSVIPPSSAIETAESVAASLAAATRHPMFIDANAIAPQTTARISEIFERRGLPFGDASIIGAPPKPGEPGPRFYMSGPVEAEAETLRGLDLDARVLSGTIGDASTLKMSYAGITKGFQALGTAMVLGAARNGALDSLIEELEGSQAALTAWLRKQLPIMYAKAYRWDGEMREIAKFLEPEPGSVMMLTGAADLYVHVAEDNAEGPDSEIISTLDLFCRART